MAYKFNISQQLAYELDCLYEKVKYKDNLLCVFMATRKLIYRIINDFLDRYNIREFYSTEYKIDDIFGDFVKFMMKRPKKFYRAENKKFSGKLNQFLIYRLKVYQKNRIKPAIDNKEISIEDNLEEVIRLQNKKSKYENFSEIIESELNKIYNRDLYLCENYLDYNISVFIAMFLGSFNLYYKDSTTYFPYNHKEYMINLATCKMIDICKRIERKVS